MYSMETVINQYLKGLLENPFVFGFLIAATEVFAHSIYEDKTMEEFMDNDLLRIIYWTLLIFLTTNKLYSSIIISFVIVLGFRLLKNYKEKCD